MLFCPATKKDVKNIYNCLTRLEHQIKDIHNIIYVDGNGKGLQSRLLKVEKESDIALKTVLSRTTALWTVFVFTVMSIGGIIGYQMYRIECLAKMVTDVFNKISIPM